MDKSCLRDEFDILFSPNHVCSTRSVCSHHRGPDFTVWLPSLSFCGQDFPATDSASLWRESLSSTFPIESAVARRCSECMNGLAEGIQLGLRTGARMAAYTPGRFSSWRLVGHRSCRLMEDGNGSAGQCDVDMQPEESLWRSLTDFSTGDFTVSSMRYLIIYLGWKALYHRFQIQGLRTKSSSPPCFYLVAAPCS